MAEVETSPPIIQQVSTGAYELIIPVMPPQWWDAAKESSDGK